MSRCNFTSRIVSKKIMNFALTKISKSSQIVQYHLIIEFKERQRITTDIEKRIAIQMGIMAEHVPEEIKINLLGINTSIAEIHKFLVTFFQFYTCTLHFIQFTIKISFSDLSICLTDTIPKKDSSLCKDTLMNLLKKIINRQFMVLRA